MSDNETFGSWLQRRRRSLDLTQQALAYCAGCSIVTIRKFEGDERRPSRQLAELLANCLAIPTDQHQAFITFARQPLTAEPASPPLLAAHFPTFPISNPHSPLITLHSPRPPHLPLRP